MMNDGGEYVHGLSKGANLRKKAKRVKTNEEKVDELYMRRCIQLARNGEGTTAPNPMVGAVIVHDGRIIGEGYHIRHGGPHAEVNAINSVKRPQLLSQSTIYVSLEPCAHYGKTPPCADLIVEKRLRRVVVGCGDPFAKVNGLGIKKLRDAGIDVKVGVLESECERLNKTFFTFHRLHRPYVILKWAQSSDGFIDKKRDNASSGPVRLSSPITKTLNHQLRTRCDAILVGARTALLDNPVLTSRKWAGKSPMRLVIDRRGTLPHDLRIFSGEVPTRVYVSTDASPVYGGKNTEVVRVSKATMLSDIMEDLAGINVQSLIVEGGAATLSAFIEQGLWDEARVETVATRLGSGVAAPKLTSAKLLNEQSLDGSHVETFVHKKCENVRGNAF